MVKKNIAKEASRMNAGARKSSKSSKSSNQGSRSRSKTRVSRMKKPQMHDAIMTFFDSLDPKKTVNQRQVAYALGIKDPGQKDLLIAVLSDLGSLGIINEVGYGKFKRNERNQTVSGVVERHTISKKTYLVPDDGGENIFIPEGALNGASNGDIVNLTLYPKRKGHMDEGEVKEIVKRKQDTFVGIIDIHDNFAFLNVAKKQLLQDIFIHKKDFNGAQNGQKCIAKIKEWKDTSKNPIGEIIAVLGDVGDNNTEMHAILAEFGLPYTYPKEIEEEANKIQSGITAEEIAKRRDMRDVVTFTIDPRDAKDFDDALSIQKLDNGLLEVGVHIADVTHYVEEGSVINDEAVNRATSVYLVDRTIPMLPEHLSNGVCSLRPNEEKLTYSVVFQLNEMAEIKRYTIGRTVTKSNRRFTYEEAQSIIETSEGDYAREMLKLNELAKILRARRFAQGAISFDRVETRFEIDEKGKPISVFFKEAKEANKLVEEFMLLANRTVAAQIGQQKQMGKKAPTFVYRVHDLPSPEKLEKFADFIKRFGYKIKTTGKSVDVSTSINSILKEVEGKGEQNLVETLAVRSMAKAVYSTDNLGHYGLAFKYYTHFTSPIRRYPDMMVHRLLTRYLVDHAKSVDKQEYEILCEHCSSQEQLAANAERASIKYKQVEYMQDHLGEVFDGVISGVTEWGIYVELKANLCEGMIPVRNLDDDYYIFDEKNYCIIGRHHGKRFQLGDELSVLIARADLIKKQLDFKLV